MRTRTVFLLPGLLAAAAFAAAQGPTPPPKVPRDAGKLAPLQQQMVRAAQRGAEWLRRANGTDGRFVPGCQPALRATLESGDYLHQIQAAHALARAARFFADERLAAVARQAVLTLLLDTTTDGQESGVRQPTLPPAVVNRLAAAGWLVLAVHELPNPGDDLLEQAEQLCHFIRKRQQGDGSLRCTDDDDPRTAAAPEGVGRHAGPALGGLMLSQRQRPAAWKADAVRQAVAHYRAGWKNARQPALVPWLTAACGELFGQTKDTSFAEFAGEMNDELCGRQHTQLDPRNPLWLGGFKEPAGSAPTHAATADCAESLAEACRVARAAGDLPRYQRYREALEGGLQYLTALQYTDANTQHFADWYRPALLGGFHTSHQDGALRLDHTARAVAALVRYLQEAP